jgi:small subunit ribosomal protein S6
MRKVDRDRERDDRGFGFRGDRDRGGFRGDRDRDRGGFRGDRDRDRDSRPPREGTDDNVAAEE